MRSGVGLCVLGLLCLHSSAFGQVVKAEAGVLIFCDDPTVEKAVGSAIHKFNERLHTGYRLALFQIVSARKSENGSDSLYSLEFSTRRSDCLAGSNKPWTDCEYLPFGRMEPLSCNATVHMTETETETKQVECLLDDFIVPEKASCLGCPVKIDETSEDLKVPLFASISKYNLASDATHLFTLNEVGFATRQVVAGFRFKLRFDMMKTICAKAEHKDLNELCVPDEVKMEFVNCNATVDVAPWRFEQPEAHIECEKGALSKRTARRRPAGWSPLRNFLLKAPTTASPSTTASAKESSEEDTTASKPAASPNTANDNPFHCPSKSWKPFQPVNHAPPTEASSLPPPVDGAFGDTDLLS